MNIHDFPKDVSSLSDALLCAGARQGRQAEADELVRRYTRLVRSIARPYYLAGGEVEDLIQEGMLGLMKALREFDLTSAVPFGVFAERCIRSNIYSAIRKARRKKHGPLNDYVSFEAPLFGAALDTGMISPAVSNPEALVLSKEADRELEQAIAGLLSTFEGKILRLYLDGYTFSEIAERLRKPYKSVDNAVTRVRRKLSAHYHSFGDSR